ncbi:helix-turn-helix transcriptional regulator [Streptomyces sp. S465]|uniref:helix-turn-helix transcriptional regulator n=1 Tax=Streptomyces sp. S465 TaxID=2979468 RepID=UPI0022A83981|nr:LuxR family transcriptional regulator [Streptomyces sp. S465]WAP57586.1 AAA family ATPase [Streptomyces sp. S465]
MSELTRLRSMLSTCMAGEGGVALVTGAVACGKTSLLNTFARNVRDSGALFLHASASRAEQLLPLGVVTQLLRTAPLSPDQSRRGARLSAECMADRPDQDSETLEQQHARVIHEFCTLLLELTAQGPVVVGIDDVQYADRLSLQFLSYLTRRLSSEPILLVLNEWAVLEPALDSFRAELLSHSHCRRIRLGPLSPAGVAELVTEHTKTWPSSPLPAACAAISGGNPLLIRALMEDHATVAGRVSAEVIAGPVVADAFREAVLVCVHRCGPDVLAGAQGLAVLDDAGTPALLARLLDIEPHQADHIVEVLTMAGLLAHGHFRHPAARTAVLDNIAGKDRTRLHRRAAELLYQEGAQATTVAAHLITSNQTDAPWTVPVLREAADQALAEDRVEQAIKLLKLAQRNCADDRQQAAVTTLLAEVEWRLNPSAAARLMPELITAARDGLLETDVTSPIALLLWNGELGHAADALNQLYRTIDPSDARAVTELHILRLWADCSYPVLPHRAPEPPGFPHPDDSLSEAATTDMRLRALTAFTAVLRQDSHAEAVTAAEQVLQSCHLGHAVMDPVIPALLALTYADRLDKAAPWCDALLAEARSRHAPAWQAMLAAVRADIALRQGDPEAAERHARAALGAISDRSWGVALGAPLGILLQAMTSLGRHAEAEELTRAAPPELFQTRWGLLYLYARGRYHLAANRLQAGLSDLTTCGELMTAWDMDLPGFIPWRADAARIHLRLGNVRQARRLAEEQLARPLTTGSRTHGIALRTLAACSELKQRPHLLRKAAEELQEQGDRLELAETLTDLSEAHYALGESDRARMMARRAWHVATECRTDALRQRLSVCLAEEDTEPLIDTAGVTALSDAERRVAALAAKGHTNREIARKLYITVSTVEQHLTRAYRKLDVRSRVDLPVWLQPSGATT